MEENQMFLDSIEESKLRKENDFIGTEKTNLKSSSSEFSNLEEQIQSQIEMNNEIENNMNDNNNVQEEDTSINNNVINTKQESNEIQKRYFFYFIILKNFYQFHFFQFLVIPGYIFQQFHLMLLENKERKNIQTNSKKKKHKNKHKQILKFNKQK